MFSKKTREKIDRVVPKPILRILRAIEFIFVDVVLQRILGTAVLVLVYFFVVGPVGLFVKAFARGSIHHPRMAPGSEWVAAVGYEPNLVKSTFQS